MMLNALKSLKLNNNYCKYQQLIIKKNLDKWKLCYTYHFIINKFKKYYNIYYLKQGLFGFKLNVYLTAKSKSKYFNKWITYILNRREKRERKIELDEYHQNYLIKYIFLNIIIVY